MSQAEEPFDDLDLPRRVQRELHDLHQRLLGLFAQLLNPATASPAPVKVSVNAGVQPKKPEPLRRIVAYMLDKEGVWHETCLFGGRKFRICNVPSGFVMCNSCHIGFPAFYSAVTSKKSSKCIYCPQHCKSATGQQKLAALKQQLVAAGRVPTTKPIKRRP